MTGIFRANNPLNASILFVYGLLLKMPWFLSHTSIPPTGNEGFLFNWIIQLLSPVFKVWPAVVPIIVYLLLFTQALSVNYLVNKRRMMAKPNYLPAMSYLLITSFFPVWNELTASLVVNSILIWVWARLTNLSTSQGARSTLFNVGIVVGICSLLYFPAISFFAIVILGLVISRPPRVTEWIMVLFGLLTVWYFVFSILFLTDQLYSYKIPAIALESWKLNWNPLQFTGMVIIGFTFILGGYFVQAQSSKQVIQVRKRWTFLFINALMLLFVPFLKLHEGLPDWVMVTLPVSVFIAAGFYFIHSKIVRAVLHWGMVAFVLYCQYY